MRPRQGCPVGDPRLQYDLTPHIVCTERRPATSGARQATPSNVPVTSIADSDSCEERDCTAG
jgi:hypothetical protein